MTSFNFDFMAYRKMAFIISIVTGILSIVSIATKGFNLGLDFTGGTVIEVHFEKPVDVEPLREALLKANIHDAITSHFGEANDVLVRVPPKSETQDKALTQTVMSALGEAVADNKPSLRRTEFVGPQVGAELRDQSGIAMLLSLALMMIYVTVRFQFKFGVACVVSLFHDTLLTLGLLSFFQITFDLTVLAAVLSLIGYSLNDSIVVSDRVR
ncbi:MAG TPA: protein translocase subunit SecF, partial [Pseudomonadales bacterium]|nr:protein translocase subunit SecF [Pseudomonadales bacterium]